MCPFSDSPFSLEKMRQVFLGRLKPIIDTPIVDEEIVDEAQILIVEHPALVEGVGNVLGADG
jgi:hypothetical protein